MAAAMTWEEILKSTAITYVNRGLTLLAVYLGQHGLRADDVLTEGNILILAGAIVAGGIDLGITLYRKKAVHNLVETARMAQAGTPISLIKAAAKEKPIVGT